MNKDEMIELITNVPGSYDDFVSTMIGWMEQDEGIRREILLQIEKKPDSNTDDLTRILWEHLGIGAPLPLVDDDFLPSTAGSDTGYMVKKAHG